MNNLRGHNMGENSDIRASGTAGKDLHVECLRCGHKYDATQKLSQGGSVTLDCPKCRRPEKSNVIPFIQPPKRAVVNLGNHMAEPSKELRNLIHLIASLRRRSVAKKSLEVSLPYDDFRNIRKELGVQPGCMELLIHGVVVKPRKGNR